MPAIFTCNIMASSVCGDIPKAGKDFCKNHGLEGRRSEGMD